MLRSPERRTVWGRGRGIGRRCLPVACLALLAIPLLANQCPQPLPRTDRHLVLVSGRIRDDLADQVVASGGRVVRTHPEIGVVLTHGLTDDAAEALGARGDVLEIDREVRLRLVPQLETALWGLEELSEGAAPAGHDPTDALHFPSQWNLHAVRADQAWEAGFLGDPGVRVAIIDTGLDPFHEDLAGLVDWDLSTAFSPSMSGPPLWADDHFHGTHVGGTVVTNGIGTSGVAPHTTLIAVKVCNVHGECQYGDVLAGILYAAAVGADVANLSLSGEFFRSEFGFFGALLQRAVNRAQQQGTLVVSSAGNEASNLQHDGNLLHWACQAATGMCIAATGPQDEVAPYSNFGTGVIDVAAPGGNFDGEPFRSMVLAPCSTRSLLIPSCQAGGLYLFLQGTSMATPHVSGAAALLLAQPGARPRPGWLRARIRASAEDLGAPGADPDYGSGFLDLCRLLGC
jgi:subtilisin family serine protease